ncbi:unnamed protein product [Merluccius merluccius]
MSGGGQGPPGPQERLGGPGPAVRVRAEEAVGPGPGPGAWNQTPAGREDPAVQVPLSPATLRSVCGTEDLSRITSLEICVDTREHTLGNIGAYLPRLAELKLNNSTMVSVRDLGSTLAHLQVLWLSRCCLKDLDGIIPFTDLKVLYMAYNSVSDLSQLSMLDQLTVLDLEGNDVDDWVQVQNLALCSQLHTLSLEGNPVCACPHPAAGQGLEYSYRVAVRELVPQLRYLDDVRVEEAGPGSISTTMGEEWAVVRDAIRDRNSTETAAQDATAAEEAWPHGRPGSALRPGLSGCTRTLTSPLCRPMTSPLCRPVMSPCSRPMTSPSSRPMTSPGSRPSPRPRSAAGSRPGSAGSDPAEADDAGVSSLTHGAGKILFCGNPVQALRARREKLRTAPPTPWGPPPRLPLHVPEHTYDLEEPGQGERSDVLADLRAWREQHTKRLQIIEKERQPEVLKVDHDDDDDDDDDDDEDLGVATTDESSEESEEEEEERSGKGQTPASPDSSFLSLSPDQPQRESLSSPDVARLLTPLPPPSPSPPVGSSLVATATRRPPGVRTQRLRLLPASVGTLGVSRDTQQQQEERLAVAGTPRAEPTGLRRAPEEGRPTGTPRPLIAPVPPTARSLAGRPRDQR